MEGRGSAAAERTLSRRRFLHGGAIAGVAGLAGCLVRGESSDLRGQIVMDGSNTVLPHGSAVAEEFMWRNNRVSIPVRGSGTGAGFQRFCADETAFQNASRRVLPDEEDRCAANGVSWLELPVVLDGIAIMIHPENDWCDCLTVEELDRIWRRDSPVETWRDVRPDADPPWPDREIDLYGRDSASGTFDYFTQAITGEYGNIRHDYSGTPDTNVIVRGVRGNRYALGFGGAGYYFENEADLAVASVDDGNGCVAPTRETIEDGSYAPLSREMFLYINQADLRRDVVRHFARFYFEEIDEDGYALARDIGIADPGERLTWTQWAARRVGYFAIDEETNERNMAAVLAAIDEVSA